GGDSETFTTTVVYPVPTITAMSRNTKIAGSSGFTLIVTGTGFYNSGASVVRWNGSTRTTTYVSNTELHATIPTSDLTNPATATVTVFNGTPGGGTSSPGLTFNIVTSLPQITALNPT